jgi:hypothetical protein
VAKASIRHHVAVLRALLADATEEDLIRSNPAAGVRVAVPEADWVTESREGYRRRGLGLKRADRSRR